MLERKAQRMRKELAQSASDPEKGGAAPRVIKTRFEVNNADRTWQHIFAKALTRPFLLFYREPIVQLLGVYMAFIYGLLYLFLTTIPGIFEGVYGEEVGIAGLNYFALGVGLTGASQINARVMDKIYVHFRDKNGGKGRPEYRLRAPFVFTGPVTWLTYVQRP